MSFNAFNSPFWDFFDTINDEVEQFNRLIQNSGLDDRVKASPRNKAVTQSGEKSNSNDQVATTNNGRRISFPSLFGSPFFGRDFDVVPPVDILDNEGDYELHVSIPGAKKEDIHLDFHPDKNEVVVSGEINGHSEEASKNLKLQERSSGKFERRITLPSSTKLDEDKIKAKYDNGVLTLKVPKVKDAAPASKRIEISSSESWETVDGDAAEKSA